MKLTKKNINNEKADFLKKFKKKKFKLNCFGDKIIGVETTDKEIIDYVKKLGLT
tara:strand:+ start:235 stop:396 length:162 start_codon:yes stop_codon:yes gene_type:complete